MNQKTENERLAALEAKFDIFYNLLTEIRDDLKEYPSTTEWVDLKERVKGLEDSRLKYAAKIGSMSVILTIVTGILVKYILKVM